jgi:TPR repeat protein
MDSIGDRFAQDRDISYTEKDQLRMLEAVADESLVAIQYQLGILYQNNGDPKALKWLTLAAQVVISDACYRLGVFYEEGVHTQHNYERAIKLYETALKGDHEDAIYRLAKLYQFGRGTPINYVKTYDLYLQASEMGHLLSFKNLNITGDQYKYSNDTTQEFTFDTTSQEYQQSLLMCEHVAEQGNIDFQYKIGIVYEHHMKELEYVNALKWYQMATSNSHKEATYRLGLLYEKGLGVDQDYKEAIRLFEQAKTMGSSDAIFRLGRAYQYGYGCDSDSNKAIEYYTLAAELQNLKSQHTLGEIYERGKMTKRNILEALKWHTKAYSQGYDPARSNLFDMYEDTPYEFFFERQLYRVLRHICSIELPEGSLNGINTDSYHMASIKLGYWHYQHGDSKLAWMYFSGSFIYRLITRSTGIIKFKYINPKDINDILDNLKTQMELVEDLDDRVLYILGKSYYKGVFEEPTEKKVKRGTEEHGSRGNEDLNTRRNVVLKQDYTKALFFLEKSAEKDNYDAQYLLGNMYHHGYGVEVDFRMVQEWYDKAATGNRDHAYKVGMVYHCDRGLQDVSKAIECYEMLRCYPNHIAFGFRYLYGTGVEKDYKKATEILTTHYEGIPQLFYLGFSCYNGPSDIRDYRRAFQLF